MKTLQQLLRNKKKYHEPKERNRMIKTQRSDTEKNNQIGEIKEKELIKLIDKIHNCLKCRKKYKKHKPKNVRN